jgi:hypothetical protein
LRDDGGSKKRCRRCNHVIVQQAAKEGAKSSTHYERAQSWWYHLGRGPRTRHAAKCAHPAHAVWAARVGTPRGRHRGGTKPCSKCASATQCACVDGLRRKGARISSQCARKTICRHLDVLEVKRGACQLSKQSPQKNRKPAQLDLSNAPFPAKKLARRARGADHRSAKAGRAAARCARSSARKPGGCPSP